MLVLVLDTATAAITAGVAEIGADGTAAVRAERVTVNPRLHGEALTPSVRACLAEVGARPSDVGAVVAGLGPGPFTGLRVGLVTAAVFAEVTGVPAYGVCTLDAVAAAARAAEPGVGPLLVATDARRREVYHAAYDGSGARVAGPEVAAPAAVRAWLDTLREGPAPGAVAPPVVAAGVGAELYRDVLGLPLSPVRHPTVAALAACAADRVRDAAPGEPRTPLYLRRPDATEPAGRKRVTA